MENNINAVVTDEEFEAEESMFLSEDENSVFFGCPNSVIIGPYTFSIDIVDQDVANYSGLMGLMNFQETKIRFVDIQNPVMTADTAIHEVIHAINASRGVGNGASEETFTSQAATGLCEFWQRNPAFVAWWEALLHA